VDERRKGDLAKAGAMATIASVVTAIIAAFSLPWNVASFVLLPGFLVAVFVDAILSANVHGSRDFRELLILAIYPLLRLRKPRAPRSSDL
jgi:hypothetical protein